MAGIAGASRVNVSGGFARSGDAIVATYTTVDYAGVVKSSGSERVGIVAQGTGGVGLNMIRGFTRGGAAVVAGFAGSNDLGVVNSSHRRPHVGGVAIRAHLSGTYMSVWFT